MCVRLGKEWDDSIVMKQITMILLCGTLFISACGQVTPQSITVSKTSTPSPHPSSTPIITVTPLPTIPSFTPTFDVSTILTVTPAPEAECPKESDASQVILSEEIPGKQYVNHEDIPEIFDYLNSGGTLEKLKIELQKSSSPYAIKDVTNDGILDLIVVSGLAFQHVNIIWCNGGTYSVFPNDIIEAGTLGSDGVIFELHDLNKNGILEVLSIGSGRAWLNVNLLEWDGNTFIDLTSSDTNLNASMIGAGKNDLVLTDRNNNGVPEMTLKGLPSWWYYPGEPLRTQIDTYSWNGKFFSPSTTFSNPQFRFQTIQDGDRETINNNFEHAMNFYEMAIESSELDWWSRERFEHDRTVAVSGTPAPDPISDPTEYPRLAAYAYYRIMLLHLVQNQEADASTTYNTLQQEFGNDTYARPYVEMASAFWEAYQPTHKMYDGCAAAIQYAVEHLEILTPLGSDYHGAQAKIYKPEDVCPFR